MLTKPPGDIDWQTWVQRWDRMQERYLVKRSERFRTIVRLLQGSRDTVERVIDLGCGTGSLTRAVLNAFQQAIVCGIDFDPTMLWLAEARLTRFGNRFKAVLADIRDPSWTSAIQQPVDAVVSATALHWFTADQLERLYQQIADVIRPGGVFLNADHVGSCSPRIQQAWERHRSEVCAKAAKPDSDDWYGFWREYSRALGLDVKETHQRVIGGWEGGVEEGLPLAWHLDKLRESGFVHVDCFWRCDCDAIYGGIRHDHNAD